MRFVLCLYLIELARQGLDELQVHSRVDAPVLIVEPDPLLFLLCYAQRVGSKQDFLFPGSRRGEADVDFHLGDELLEFFLSGFLEVMDFTVGNFLVLSQNA